MPLVLTLREGEDFYVRDKRFVVSRLVSRMAFDLTGPDGKVHHITDERAAEIDPEVFVSAGDHPPSSTARVAIEADRSIPVIRGEKYHTPNPKEPVA